MSGVRIIGGALAGFGFVALGLGFALAAVLSLGDPGGESAGDLGVWSATPTDSASVLGFGALWLVVTVGGFALAALISNGLEQALRATAVAVGIYASGAILAWLISPLVLLPTIPVAVGAAVFLGVVPPELDAPAAPQ